MKKIILFIEKNRKHLRLIFVRKNILPITIAFLIVIFGVLYFRTKTPAAASEWYDYNWNYRQAVNITIGTTSTTVMKDVDTLLTIDTNDLVTAGKLQADCDDLRFTAVNGNKLPYYIDSGCNSDTTKIWLLVDEVPSNVTTYTAYMYYGNSSAQSGSDAGIFSRIRSLAGYWSANEGVGTSIGDASLNDNIGTFGQSGSAPSWVAGEYGNALSFDGTDDYVNFGDIAFTNVGTSDFTVSTWMKTSWTGGARYAISKRVSCNASFDAWNLFVTAAGVVQFELFEAGPVNENYVNTASTVNDGVWHHIAYVRINETVYGYFDGKLEVTDPGAGTTDVSNTASLLFGENPCNGTAVAFPGMLDDVRFYTRALSTLEVASLYNNPGSMVSTGIATTYPSIAFGSEEYVPGPIGYWKMDEGNGSTTYNSTDNTGGTITGAVWQNEDMCINGKCLFFDGTDDIVDTGKDFSWAQTESFSMSGWVNMKRAGNASVWGKGTTGSTWEYKMGVAGTSPQFVYWNTGGTGAIGVTSSVPIKTNNWHHLAITYDGTAAEANIYVDGKVTGTQTGVTGTFQDRSNNLNIGRAYYNSGAAGTFPGMVDDLKVFDYKRSPEEIKTEFIQGASGKGSSAVLGASSDSYLSNGLVGYWKMDEVGVSGSNWTALDSSRNNNTGTGSGNASVGTTIPGKFGNAGFFDGNGDYVDFGDMPTTEGVSQLTLSFWVRPAVLSTSDALIAKANTANQYGWAITTNAADSNDISCTLPTSTTDPNTYAMTNSDILSNGIWAHITCIFDGTANGNENRLKIYVNGVQTPVTYSGTIPTTTQATTSNVRVASSSDGALYLTGSMDEVRIYNRSLTEQEVAQLYNWAPGPVGYWDLNDNKGTTVADKSGNNYTGSFGAGTSAPQWATGKFGPGIYFDGSADYVGMGDVADQTSSFTVSAWIHPKSNAARRIVTKDNGVSGWALSYGDGGANTVRFFIRGLSDVVLDSKAEVPLNEWTYVTGIWDTASDSKYVYVNGNLSAGDTPPTTGDPVDTTHPLTIGGPSLEAGAAFLGNVDDVKIYNYVRTTKQIIQDMNAGHPAVGSPVGSAFAHWKFDEGYGTIINNNGNVGSTLNGNFGTGNSAPTWTNDGKFGKALNFDGTNDYVSINRNDAFSLINGYTIGGWFYFDNIPASNFTQLVAQWGGGGVGAAAWSLDITNSTGRLHTSHHDATTTCNLDDSTTTLTTGRWYHLATTYTGGTSGINGYQYVNGKLVNAGTFTCTPQAASNYWVGLGRGFLMGSNTYFKGKMDDIKIYNYPLTDDEIKVDYNRGKSIVLGSTSTGVGGTAPDNSASREYCVPGDTSTCNSPVGEWSWNENIGGTGFDTSTNSNNAFFASGTASPAWGPGLMGSAVSFDGDADYVTMGDVLDMGTSDWTTSLWFKTNDTDGNLISKSLAGALSGRWYTILQAGGISSVMEGSVAVGISTPSAAYVDGGWHHVSTTYDRDGNMSLYVDGKLKNSADISANSATDMQTSCHLLLGRYNDSANCAIPYVTSIKLDGLVDQVRIYNYVRTPAQIAWEYSKGAPVVHYKMDECQGTTIYNSVRTFNNRPAGTNGNLIVGTTGPNTTAGTCETSGAWASGATGKYGASIDFDGTDDFVNIGGTFLYTEETVSFWAKADWATATGMPLSSLTFTNPDHDGFRFQITSGAMAFVIYNNSQAEYAKSTPVLTGSDWHHFLLTWTPTITRSYLDGKKIDQTSRTNAFDGFPLDMDIGRYNYQNNTYFNGQVDEVKIYNYSMTDQQVKTLYNNGAVNFK